MLGLNGWRYDETNDDNALGQISGLPLVIKRYT